VYQIIALITGLATAVMMTLNGRLADAVGVFPSAAIIHAVGVVFALLICAVRRWHPIPKNDAPWWSYTAGVIGVMTTIFINIAFRTISMTSIIALSLLGQTVASLVFDHTGIFGMEKRPFRHATWIGLAFSLVGIYMMLDRSVTEGIVAVLLALASGIVMVATRAINAELARHIGALRGSFVNHLAGLPITVALALALAKTLPPTDPSLVNRPWIYLGGIIGVLVILSFNVIVPQITQFHITVLTFVGQIFAGLAIDWMLERATDDATFAGGIIIAVGIALNLFFEYREKRKTARR
jgi:transporter family-2 protein